MKNVAELSGTVLVLVKHQGKWLLTAGQNTEANVAATADDPARRSAK
ncbi:hypothetical protein [Hymenobacter swuensis]|nr:hypothetical protein [Hymenobacter swuensis]